MGILSLFKSKAQEEIKQQSESLDALESMPDSSYAYSHGRNNWQPIVTEYFDGEKTPGELGYIKNLLPNHTLLRHRVYEAELKSDIVKIITGKFFKFVVGSGLKLQAEPQQDVLKSEKIPADNLKDFRTLVEARFAVYADSKVSDYHGMQDLHKKAVEAYTSAFLGGDCLCVLRVDEDGNLNIQVIDGQHVKTPFLDETFSKEAEERGNTIKHGIELSPKGQHVAYYVLVDDKNNLLGKYERISAKGDKTGRLLAWMVYGAKHRIDHHRGIPVITQILEKVEKFERYTEAAVGSAEERAKIVFSIQHSKDSDGENPLLDKARLAAGLKNADAPETTGYALGEKTASTIAATTQKQTFNLPVGAELKALSSTTELQYETFSKAVFSYLCAAVDIPPEVAMQLYEQNYSSSRAAINAWDYIAKIHRKDFAKNFYQNFYNLWLELEVIKNKVSAPGFISALRQRNFMVTESYFRARWVGTNMPHIDPLKEVKAIRAMLGNDDDPLISREQASEFLGSGDWQKNVEKYKEEEKALPPKPEPEPIKEPNKKTDG